jgi:hypothetical protein
MGDEKINFRIRFAIGDLLSYEMNKTLQIIAAA